MTESQACVAFNLVANVGIARVERMAKEYGSVASAWERYPDKLSRSGEPVDWVEEFARAERFGVRIVTPFDDVYPKQMKDSPGRPLALYVKGDVSILSTASVAIVGTRRATAYGKTTASSLAYDLSKAGWTIVSGLALGIDAEAHRGAIAAEGRTIGIIGSALDRFYPEENRELAREIVAKGGAVVSEFPFGRAPDKETFPIRNHVVAAISRGVIAVEAPRKSGTLITTGIAADLGRTVMAVPARIDSRMSAGCLELIREGATLVRNADDVLEALSEFLPRDRRASRAHIQAEDPQTPRYSVEEAMIMLHVDGSGISVDELVRETRLPVAKVNALLMTLRLKGFIRFLPGNRVVSCAD